MAFFRGSQLSVEQEEEQDDVQPGNRDDYKGRSTKIKSKEFEIRPEHKMMRQSDNGSLDKVTEEFFQLANKTDLSALGSHMSSTTIK